MRHPTDGGILMADFPLDLLSDANPVREAPTVESPERLRQLIEAAGPGASTAGRGPARVRRRVLRAVATVAVAGIAATAGLLLSNGSSSPGVNVVAAAYAAITPKGGIIEARFVQWAVGPHGRRKVMDREREWIDASTGMHRTQALVPHFDGKGIAAETAIRHGWYEDWSGARGERDVIDRGPVLQLAGRTGPRAASGIEAYRRLYLDRSLRLVGRERLRGRLLWKLEGPGSVASYSANSKPVPIETVVVLVDPSTYLPVVRRSINLLKPGHPAQEETELVGYRRLPAGADGKKLLSVSAHHPHARIVTHIPKLKTR